MKINTKDTDINNIMQAVSFALVSAREHKTGSFWGVNEDSWRKHLEDLAHRIGMLSEKRKNINEEIKSLKLFIEEKEMVKHESTTT